MRSVKARVLAKDDKTLYVSKDVAFTDGVSLRTPMSAGDVRLRVGDEALPDAVRGINELYKGFPAERLANVQKEEDSKFVREFATPAANARNRGDLNLVIPAIDAIPTKDIQIQYIADTAYVPADMLTVPVLKDARQAFEGSPKTFDAYQGFVKAFIEDVERLNKKVVFGVLPPVAYGRIQGLVETYVDAGINAFCVDLGGRSPSAEHERNLRPLLKHLQDHDLRENSFIYALNAQSGRPGRQPKAGIAPAQDVLAYGFGFDALGLRHVRKAMGKAAEKDEAKQAPKFRFFDRHQYAYRSVSLNAATKSLPADATVSLGGLRNDRVRNALQRMVSLEQMALETKGLQVALKESRLEKHLAGKSEVDDAVRKSLRSARSAESQKTLW